MVYDVAGNVIADLSGARDKKRFRVLEYNISNFTGDGSFDGYAGNDLAGYIGEWASFIGSMDADICLFVENRRYIDASNTTSSVTALFSKLYDYVSDYDVNSQAASWAYPWRTAILSNEQQNDITKAVFRNQADANGSSKYIKSVVNLNGIDICVIVVHLTHSAEQISIDTRALQMQELITMTSDYENVIIGGDFNTRSLTEIDAMKQAGFTFGNGGIFGDFLTQPKPTPTFPVDNVCVRGPNLKLQRYSVLYDVELSDHYPTIADIIVG